MKISKIVDAIEKHQDLLSYGGGAAVIFDQEEKEFIADSVKKQEKKHPDSEGYLQICHVCKSTLYIGQKYCGECGNAVDWSE